MKSKSEKKQVLDVLQSKFSKAAAGVVVDYQGIKAGEMDALRSMLRKNNVDFYVAKNSLARIAAKSTAVEKITKLFKGPMSIAVSEDPVASAKWLFEYAKTNEKIKIIGGFLGDKTLTLEEVKALAKLPSLNGMRSQFLSVLMGVPSKFVRLVNALKEKTEGTSN